MITWYPNHLDYRKQMLQEVMEIGSVILQPIIRKIIEVEHSEGVDWSRPSRADMIRNSYTAFGSHGL